MTTIGIPQQRNGTAVTPIRSERRVLQLLVACGMLSGLLYIATDIIGGLRYAGYSFFTQTISELGAVGAPSQPFVDPLFLVYEFLALAFGIGVLWTALRRNRALRVTGALLIVYGALGLVAANFPLQAPRGQSTMAADLPHIIVTGVIVVSLLSSMVAGAFALGRRFRVYSLATVLTVTVTTALTVPFAMRLAAGQPTPGFGIVERIAVYGFMIWTVVLSIAILRRPAGGNGPGRRAAAPPRVEGFVAPGFEEVRTRFEQNFAERGEIGAAVAAYWQGEKVVDLWGGRRSPDDDAPWNEDTMVVVMSTTKGLAAMTLAVANARGWLDYDAPVSRYWPEFAQNGKADVTVRQLLAHEAGLVLLDEKLTIEKLHDLDYVARVLARQKPAWTPGTRHGYHTMTLGLYMQELIRRVDPQHRTLGRFFHEEIARPLDLEFYIGLPRDIPAERLATLKTMSWTRAFMALRNTPLVLLKKVLQPASLLRRSFVGLSLDWNDRRSFDVEVPAGNGVGTARAIARAYSAHAEGGAELGITPMTFARVTLPPKADPSPDIVIGLPAYFSLGFLRPGPEVAFGSTPRAFGAPGAGGSFAFADPDAHLGYAYVMNKLDFWLMDDPREKALRDAIYRAIRRLGASSRASIAAESLRIDDLHHGVEALETSR